MLNVFIILLLVVVGAVAGLVLLKGGTDNIERFLYWVSSLTGSDAAILSQLKAPIEPFTFVTEGNSLITFFRVVGSRKFIGPAEAASQAQGLCDALTAALRAGYHGQQHSVLFGFRSDPANGAAVIKKMLQPSLNTATRFGADVGFLFRDKLAAMAADTVDETAIFGLVTHMRGLTPTEVKRATDVSAKQFASIAKQGIALDPYIVQTPYGPPALLLSRHLAAVAALAGKIDEGSDSGQTRVMLDKLTVHEAANEIKRYLDAGHYNPNWRPQLLGDQPTATIAKRSTRVVDSALPLSVGRQLISEKIVAHFADAEMAKHGKHWYASLTLDVAPQDEETPFFSELANAIGTSIPWQVHMDITPNGLEFNKMEAMFAAFMGAAGDHNKQIKMAMDELKAMKSAGRSIVVMRLLFSTWAETQEKCVDRLATLKSNIEGWGQTVVSNESGAPDHVLVATAPGFARSLPARYIPGPLEAFSRMAPMFRPSSVWEAGQLVLSTREGRPYPIQLGSTLQNFWGTLIFAPTGSGKSFLMNMLNMGVIFSPGLTDLPMVTIIDKGPSAKGAVMLAKALLPPEMSDQIDYWRPMPTESSYAVNPFDTQLGCDKPTSADMDFQRALLGGIAPNLGKEGGHFIGRVIEVAYEMFERRSPQAKRWQWTTNLELSDKLESIGIAYSDEKPPRVWDVVDAFFARGMVTEAIEAQYHAVPVLTDLTQALQDHRVTDLYGAAPAETGERMIEVFSRNIISAASEYRLMSSVTRHKADCRFKVIDIDGLAGANLSEEGRRRFGIMMLFARRLGARNFFLDWRDLEPICPPAYAEYQRKRIQKIQEQLKFLEYDEIHNAKGIVAVQELLHKDAREGRKYGVVGVLSSQELDDFPKELVNNSYNFLILGCGSNEQSHIIQETFGLNDSERQVIASQCTSPGKLFGVFKTTRGTLSQLLMTKPGRLEMWAYNTSMGDSPLRNALYERIGVKHTLGFLSEHFPGGTARPAIKSLSDKMGSDVINDDGITEMMITQLKPKLNDYLSAHGAAALA